MASVCCGEVIMMTSSLITTAPGITGFIRHKKLSQQASTSQGNAKFKLTHVFTSFLTYVLKMVFIAKLCKVEFEIFNTQVYILNCLFIVSAFQIQIDMSKHHYRYQIPSELEII